MFQLINLLSILVTIHPLAGPHYLNLLNQLMAIRSSSGFSHLWPGVFHISLQTHETQHTQSRGGRKEQQTSTDFGSLLCGFLCICGLSRACIQMKFLHSYQEHWLILSHWSTWLLDPQILAPRLAATSPWPLPSSNFCWMLSPVDCLHALAATSPWPCLPSSSGLLGNLVYKPFVWVSCQNRQRDYLTGTHPHSLKQMPPIVPHTHLNVKLFLCKTLNFSQDNINKKYRYNWLGGISMAYWLTYWTATL